MTIHGNRPTTSSIRVRLLRLLHLRGLHYQRFAFPHFPTSITRVNTGRSAWLFLNMEREKPALSLTENMEMWLVFINILFAATNLHRHCRSARTSGSRSVLRRSFRLTKCRTRRCRSFLSKTHLADTPVYPKIDAAKPESAYKPVCFTHRSNVSASVSVYERRSGLTDLLTAGSIL